jgi:hypothetical protein
MSDPNDSSSSMRAGQLSHYEGDNDWNGSTTDAISDYAAATAVATTTTTGAADATDAALNSLPPPLPLPAGRDGHSSGSRPITAGLVPPDQPGESTNNITNNFAQIMVGTNLYAAPGDICTDLLRHFPPTVTTAVLLHPDDRSRKRQRTETDRKSNHDAPPPPKSSNSSTNLTTMQELSLIRIVTRMLRDQADLCCQQATQLEDISRNILKGTICSDDEATTTTTTTTRKNNDYENTSSKEQYHEDCQKEIKELKRQMHEYTLERQAMIKLSTNCYRGMKQLQKTMDAFLQERQQNLQQESYRNFEVENQREGDLNFDMESFQFQFHRRHEMQNNVPNRDSIVTDQTPQKEDTMTREEEKLDKDASDSEEESQEDYESSILGSFLNNPELKPIEVVRSHRRISERRSDDSFSSSDG